MTGNAIDAVAQITKTGHVWVFDREHGQAALPRRGSHDAAAVLAGDRTAPTQHFPTLPPPFTRQRITARRSHDAHAGGARRGAEAVRASTAPTIRSIHRTTNGTIIFPGVDGGGEWGGPAFDPTTGLLYVNANEMAWLLKLVPRSDKSLYAANCASCHGDESTGQRDGAVARRRRRRDARASRSCRSSARAPAACPPSAARSRDARSNDIVNFLITGHDSSAAAGPDPIRRAVPQRVLRHLPRPRRLSRRSRRRGAR